MLFMGLYIVFINTNTEHIFKSMAQSSAKIHNHNDMIIDLEKKLELLTKGSHFITILFKNLSTENRGNAKILYNFLESEYNIQNVKLSTIVTHIKAICLFNEYLSYKDFEKITNEDIIYYLSSLRNFFIPLTNSIVLFIS